MEVSYDDTRLEALLNDPRGIQRTYGAEVAKRLAARLTALRAAVNLAELHDLPGRTHPLSGDRTGQYAMDLPRGQRLIFAPTAPVPLLPDGGIDLRGVTRVTILEIVDYH